MAGSATPPRAQRRSPPPSPLPPHLRSSSSNSPTSSPVAGGGGRTPASFTLSASDKTSGCVGAMASGEFQEEFRFFLSGDIGLPIAFRVLHADHIILTEKRHPELFVECKLYMDGVPFGLPIKTRLESSGPPYSWNELITLTAKYRDLTSLSQLVFMRLLQTIIKSPPTRPLLEVEKQLMWKFRFSLMSEKKALTKFVRSVDWNDVQEAKQAVKLIGKWETVDMADALELLSPEFEREEILVEIHDPVFGRRYNSTYTMLKNRMMNLAGREGGAADEFGMWKSLSGQYNLTAQLYFVMEKVRNVHGSAQKKIEKLRELLSGGFSKLTNFNEPTCSPLSPTILLTGVVPQESTIFKSALHPLRLTFKTANGGTCKIIFKKGDDLRQDQLVIQMVSLMDRLLKLENLDLHLTPYRVLATGQDEGMFEFIPSSSLAQVLSEHRSIINYLKRFHPDENVPFGITAQCLDTFIKSGAGYSVITYILGVGDRHLDNLLLTDDGRLFHVDFAFILGRDPKPFPPPMKLCKEMVEAMGGAESTYYARFKSYCCEAYNILRKSSSLILNLFKLMGRSNIPDISSDGNGDVKGIGLLQQKFRLDLDDEAAIHFFQDLINESVSALFPQMVETIHRWAQYWR
ncbi:hypothetical protein ACP4OV_031802 [Aristida adscensionis]